MCARRPAVQLILDLEHPDFAGAYSFARGVYTFNAAR